MLNKGSLMISKTETNKPEEAYTKEKQRVIQQLKRDPILRRRYLLTLMAYLVRRLLWSFGFFPVFLAVWIPLILSKFNLVIVLVNVRPLIEDFLNATPNMQASMTEAIITAWLSTGAAFAVFDMIITPFKSPYQSEIDIQMRAWAASQQTSNATPTADHHDSSNLCTSDESVKVKNREIVS